MAEEQDLSELLDKLVWAHKIVKTKDRSYVFRPLTIEERNMANYIYQESYDHHIGRGVPTRQELTKRAIKNGQWSASGEKDASLLREELASILLEASTEERVNANRRTPTSKLKKLRKRVEYVTLKIRELEHSHTIYIELPSAEYTAERDRSTYMLHCATLDFPTMNQTWPEYTDLLNEERKALVGELMNLYFSTDVATESQIRELARSGIWRIKWSGAKKNRGVKTLFGREMYDLTIDQFRLIYWSQIYDSAFESMEPPSDEVVEDDKLFDMWLDEQHNKRKQERKESELNKKIKKTSGGVDGQEVGFNIQGYYCEECNCGVSKMKERRGQLHAPSCPNGVFIYYNEETKLKKVEEIQSANPDSMRQILAQEQKKLADRKGDLIQEQDLRSDSKTRAAFGMPTNIVGSDDKGKQGRAR